MRTPTIKHEDSRRILIEFIKDTPIRTAKALYITDNMSPLGAHYHKLKDDVFFLVKGSGTYTLDGKREIFNQGDCIYVKAGVKHSFDLMRGSILLEASTLPYDKEDEYEI